MSKKLKWLLHTTLDLRGLVIYKFGIYSPIHTWSDGFRSGLLQHVGYTEDMCPGMTFAFEKVVKFPTLASVKLFGFKLLNRTAKIEYFRTILTGIVLLNLRKDNLNTREIHVV